MKDRSSGGIGEPGASARSFSRPPFGRRGSGVDPEQPGQDQDYHVELLIVVSLALWTPMFLNSRCSCFLGFSVPPRPALKVEHIELKPKLAKVDWLNSVANNLMLRTWR